MMEQGQSEEEGAAEMECYASDRLPHPTAPLEVQQVKELGVKLSLGRMRWGVGGR